MDEADYAEEKAREKFDDYLEERFPVGIEGLIFHPAEVLQTLAPTKYERLFKQLLEEEILGNAEKIECLD